MRVWELASRGITALLVSKVIKLIWEVGVFHARRRKSRGARGLVRLKKMTLGAITFGLVALICATAAAAAGAATVPNPAVQGPIQGGVHGYPWNHSVIPLTGNGYSYTENEYFFSGMATNLAHGLTAPYESRMLVRLPQDPKKFNGTVIVEWLNVTGGNDLETVWPVEGQYLMQRGTPCATPASRTPETNSPSTSSRRRFRRCATREKTVLCLAALRVWTRCWA